MAPQAPGILTTALDTLNRARDLVAADPSTLDPISRLARAGLRQYCRGVAGPTSGAGSTAFGLVGGGYVCEPLYEEPGNSPGDPSPPPPFEGGQCPVTYNVTINYSYLNLFNNVPVSQTGTVNGVGPIASIDLQATNAPGSNFLIRVTFSDGVDTIQNFTVGPSGFANAQASIVSIVRADGQPDDCGSLPAPPPIPPTVANPYNWGDPEIVDGVPVSTDEPAGGGPSVNIDIGGVPLNIDFSGGGVSLPPEFGESSGAANGIPVPSGGGDVPFGDPPEGSEWIGARWDLSGVPLTAGRWSGNPANPNFLEINGIIRLSLAASDGAASWLSTPQEMRAQTGEIVRPVPAISVTGVQVFSRYVDALTIYPIAAKVEG